MNLYDKLLEAKSVEQQCVAYRVELEELIAKQLGVKEEGSETHTIEEDDNTYKVVVTGVINRRLDVAIWDAVSKKIPENLRPVKYKPEVDIKGMRYIQNNEPEIYTIFAEAMTAKPGKTSVKVEKVKA